MPLAYVKNNSIVEYPYSLVTFRNENPSVSLPIDPSEEQLNEQDVYTVYEVQQPPYDVMTQNLIEGQPEYNEGKWIQTWVVSDASQEEIDYRTTNAKAEINNQARKLLTETDWTSIPSIADPEECNPYLANRQEFLEYRNAIRAIVLDTPVHIETWPTLPAEVWEFKEPDADAQPL